MSVLEPESATDMNPEEINASRVNPGEVDVPFDLETVASQGWEPRACETDGDGVSFGKVGGLIKVAVSQDQRTRDTGMPKIQTAYNTRAGKAQDGARLIISLAHQFGNKITPDLPFCRPG